MVHQLDRESYEKLRRVLTDAQLVVLKGIDVRWVWPIKGVRTVRALQTAGLLTAEEKFTDLGWQMYAACHVEPGSFPSLVAQVLLDLNYTWALLPGLDIAPESTFQVVADTTFGGAWVSFSTPSSTDMLGKASKELSALGFRVQQPGRLKLHVENPDHPLPHASTS